MTVLPRRRACALLLGLLILCLPATGRSPLQPRAVAGLPPGLSGSAGGTLGADGRARDAVDDLRRWARRLDRARSPLSVEEVRQLDRDLAELGPLLASSPDRRGAGWIVLLDLLEAGEALSRSPSFGPGAENSAPAERVRAVLRAQLKGPQAPAAAAFLATEVLRGPREHGAERRRLAALALGQVRREEALPALLASATDPLHVVATAARKALIGWEDPRVHLVFLDLLEQRLATRLCAQHLTGLGERLGPQALERLRALLGRQYVSEDWREAARAQAVVGALDAERAAPVLIEALAVWTRREASGTGSKRILEEIVVELRRISGRNLGRDPALWNRWWGDVLAGTILLPEAAAARGEPLTTAAFFGLRLASDRVLFVVDRSGSMETKFGTGGRSRYEEAVEQLFRYLEGAGPTTRFSLALFADDASTWRAGRLVEADAAGLRAARRWLGTKRPKGGTELRAGLFDALGADRAGRVDAGRLEADTVVVLCDGATAAGPGWVAPWVRETGEALQLVVHGIQIGSFGDGTLEALAAGTGGRFLRIER